MCHKAEFLALYCTVCVPHYFCCGMLKRFHSVASRHQLKINPRKSCSIRFAVDLVLGFIEKSIELNPEKHLLPDRETARSLKCVSHFLWHVFEKTCLALKAVYNLRSYLSINIKKMLSDWLVLSKQLITLEYRKFIIVAFDTYTGWTTKPIEIFKRYFTYNTTCFNILDVWDLWLRLLCVTF